MMLTLRCACRAAQPAVPLTQVQAAPAQREIASVSLPMLKRVKLLGLILWQLQAPVHPMVPRQPSWLRHQGLRLWRWLWVPHPPPPTLPLPQQQLLPPPLWLQLVTRPH